MTETQPEAASITGIVLAGGLSRRMGTDKALLRHGELRLIEHVLARLQPQLARICINANQNPAEYAALGWPVFADDWPDFRGPLAGCYSAIRHCPGPWYLSVPCDTPRLPRDLVARLSAAARQHAVPVVSVSDGRFMHGAVCLYHRDCAPSLRDYLQAGERSIQEWIRSQPHHLVDYSDQAEAFDNINTPEQLERLSAS